MANSHIVFFSHNPFSETNKTQQIWQTIEKNAHNSFYLSWHWMENWLNCLPNSQNIQFIYASYKGQPVFCYFLGIRKTLQHKFIYCNRAYLNQTGENEKDCIIIEHNGVLVDSSFVRKDFSHFFQKSNQWDELVAKFVNPNQTKYFSTHNNDFNHRLEESDKAFSVDLNKVREHKTLLPLLSKNKRSQIKRSIKAYETTGELQIRQADSLKDAHSILRKLIELHQRNWINKGKKGSFASSFFMKFHNKLISNYFDSGNIHLVQITAGEQVIGCLYNFSYKNNIYMYQTGFNFQQENVYRPGLTSHYLAINYYASLGYKNYDLLVGEMAYKRSLSTDSYLMPCYRLRKNKLIFKFEDILRNLKQKYNTL